MTYALYPGHRVAPVELNFTLSCMTHYSIGYAVVSEMKSLGLFSIQFIVHSYFECLGRAKFGRSFEIYSLGNYNI